MLIATIVPTKNEAVRIESVLRSVLAWGPDELMVVDAGSTDDTEARVRALGVATFVETGGVVAQLNEAARRSAGDVLLFLHADCRVDFDPYGAIREALTNAAVVAGGFRLHYGDGLGWRAVAAAGNLRGRRLGLPMGDQGIFIRRDVFLRLGGFRSGPLLPDLDLVARAREHGSVVLRPERLYTSPRRYRENGFVRNLLANQLLLTAHQVWPEQAPAWAVRWLARLRERRRTPRADSLAGPPPS